MDQYTFADNSEALTMTTWMVEYFYNRVQNVITKYSVERHWYSLNEETGGMNDVLYRLFTITVRNLMHVNPLYAHLIPYSITCLKLCCKLGISISRNDPVLLHAIL